MKLPKEYYQQATLWIARDLLGKILVVQRPEGQRSGRIVETEAYCGPNDRASHASRGRTVRTAPMFAAGGVSYVYLIYGMYHCFNIVTEPADYPAAVLVRAVEPLDATVDPRSGAGPGKLCRWLGITRQDNRIDLTGSTIYIEEGSTGYRPQVIITTARIGIDYAGAWAEKPWRFYLADSRAISKR